MYVYDTIEHVGLDSLDSQYPMLPLYLDLRSTTKNLQIDLAGLILPDIVDPDLIVLSTVCYILNTNDVNDEQGHYLDHYLDSIESAIQEKNRMPLSREEFVYARDVLYNLYTHIGIMLDRLGALDAQKSLEDDDPFTWRYLGAKAGISKFVKAHLKATH